MSWNLRNTTEIESAIDAALEALNQLGASDEFARGYTAGLLIVAKALNVHCPSDAQSIVVIPNNGNWTPYSQRSEQELLEICQYP